MIMSMEALKPKPCYWCFKLAATRRCVVCRHWVCPDCAVWCLSGPEAYWTCARTNDLKAAVAQGEAAAEPTEQPVALYEQDYFADLAYECSTMDV